MDENLQPQEGMNPESEVIEETDASERIAELEAQLAEERQAKTEILARAKKAEAQNTTVTKPSITNNSISEEDVEIKILKSQGVDDELLGEMKALAKVRGKSILEIQNDPILKAMKEAKEAEEKAKASRLPASRGSAPAKKEKSFSTSGLSDEDFKALWKERQSK